MERLTIQTEKGAALKMADSYESEAAARQDLMVRYRVAVARLAQYEDKGLEPEEAMTAKEMAKVACALNLLKEYRSVGSVEHFRELSQAEQDGRLVVLPCKVGDTVYFPIEGRWNTATIDHIEIYPDEVRFGWVEYDAGPELTELWEEGCFTVENIGKTVFLTREEAEAELNNRERRKI